MNGQYADEGRGAQPRGDLPGPAGAEGGGLPRPVGAEGGGVHGVQGYGGPGPVRGPLLRQCPLPYRRHGSGHVAAVQMYDNGGHTVLWPDRPREDVNRPWLRQPVRVFEVALGRHVARFGLPLPAAGDAEFFQAEAAVHWQVEDPVLVVRHQVWDVAELVHDDLVDQLRYVSRRFRLNEAQLADEAVRAELDSERFGLGSDLGLRTKVHARIDLSERVVERVREGTGLDHELDLTERQHRIDRRKQQHRGELVQARARELQAAMADGDDAKIAHFMALEPGSELDIARLFARESQQYKADRLAFLTKMLDTGVVERHQVSELTSEALKALKEQSGRVLGESVGRALPQETDYRRELDAGSLPRRRRPFWETGGDDDTGRDDDTGPELEEAPGEGDSAGPSGVHEPSSVESAEERAERTRGADDLAAPRRRGRASDRFDDWGD
ncbi:hypothetical protein [Streptomyces winkii]|uniref:hypothetical protein n=1 Tax=Streptomyces winkii TaxID=3051178 RepID=UPI0028D12D39|nr:hypothetical protein [Streptomyces sp. DSM 40971]